MAGFIPMFLAGFYVAVNSGTYNIEPIVLMVRAGIAQAAGFTILKRTYITDGKVDEENIIIHYGSDHLENVLMTEFSVGYQIGSDKQLVASYIGIAPSAKNEEEKYEPVLNLVGATFSWIFD